MRRLIAWVFLLLGSFLLGIGQRISEEAYAQWADLLADELIRVAKD